MFNKFLTLVLIGAVLALAAAPATAQGGDPADVVSSFYGWLLDYAGYDATSSEFRNPLVDGSYEERPEVSPDLIAKIDAMREAEGGLHYDPLTCAQDVAESFMIADVMPGDDGSASVLVETFFGWNPHPNTFVVTLRDEPGTGWQITGVDCQETVTPRGVTEAFYAWYLGQVPPAPEGDYPFLTAELNARIQGAERELGGGDPVLCAQDVPAWVAVDVAMAGHDEASMLVRTFFANNPDAHLLTVHLVRGDDAWQIDDIVCEAAPETVAALLYNEYIAYRQYDIQHGAERTPLADWSVYPWADYIGEELLASLLETYRGDEFRPADPFLCAQDIPAWATATAILGPQSDSVQVEVMGAFPSGPDTVSLMKLADVAMAPGPRGNWQIVSIACAR